MKVSVSNTGQGKVYTYGFKFQDVTLDELVSVANSCAVSGAEYEGGHRKASNVLSGSNLILIDCDEPGQAEAVEARLSMYDYVKVPSASNLSNDCKWHYFIPTQVPLSIYPGGYKYQVQQFFNQVGITDEMIDVTGSYDIARQFAPAMFDGADDLSVVNDTELRVPVMEVPEELSNEAYESITVDIEGIVAEELPLGSVWYQGKAITYADTVKALSSAGEGVIVSGFGCPHNRNHSLDNKRGYGFAYKSATGEVVIKCSGNACKDEPYFVVPEEHNDEVKTLDPISKPISPDKFAVSVKERILDLNSEFYVGHKLNEAFEQFGNTYNECVKLNGDGEAYALVVPSSTGSGKSVSARLYLASIAKLGLSGLLVVSEVATALEAANEINELAGTDVAGVYYSISDKNPVDDVRCELDELPPIGIITHALFIQRSDSGRDIDSIRNYNGKQRDCIIIDERIDLIKRVSFSTDEIPDAIAILQRDDKLEDIVVALNNMNDVIYNSSKASNATAQYTDEFKDIARGSGELFQETAEKIEAGMYKLKPRIRGNRGNGNEDAKQVANLLRRIAFTTYQRYSHTKEGSRIVCHREEDLSGAFGSCVVLDATATINPEYKMRSINNKPVRFFQRIQARNYQSVRLNINRSKGLAQSRAGITTSVIDDYLKIIGDALFMSDDRLLVVTYQNLVPLFKERCQYDNVDFIHWGGKDARGSNAFSEYTKAMAIGWYRKPQHVYIASVLAPDIFGHHAGVNVDSAPEGMWTPCRRT